MSFSEKSRQWWLRVWGEGDANNASCQKLFIQRKKGFIKIAKGETCM